MFYLDKGKLEADKIASVVPALIFQWEQKVATEIKVKKKLSEKEAEIYFAQIKELLLKKITKENPRLLPLVKAYYLVEKHKTGLPEITIGQPITGKNVEYEYSVTRSILYLVDELADIVQGMKKILVKDKENTQKILKLYSDPINPAFKYFMLNGDATEGSLAFKLLKYVEDHQLEVMGWVKVI